MGLSDGSIEIVFVSVLIDISFVPLGWSADGGDLRRFGGVSCDHFSALPIQASLEIQPNHPWFVARGSYTRRSPWGQMRHGERPDRTSGGWGRIKPAVLRQGGLAKILYKGLHIFWYIENAKAMLLLRGYWKAVRCTN
jgi:hypothetical protein